MERDKLPGGPISEKALIHIMRQLQSVAKRGTSGKWMAVISSQGDDLIRVQEAGPPHRYVRNR